MPKRKISARPRKKQEAKRPAVCPPWKKKVLQQLDELLTDMAADAVYVKDVSLLTTAEEVLELKRAYEQTDNLGVIVLTHAVSPRSLQEATMNLKKAIVAMWQDQLPDHVVHQLLFEENTDLSILEPYRNSKMGIGNVAFGYWGKHIPPEYVYNTIEGQSVALDLDYMYSYVNLPLLTHEDNTHTAVVLLALSPEDSMVSQDSVKEARDPCPKPSSMTEQSYTPPHIDWYHDPELDRRQAIINGDEHDAKLFYVPGSQSNRARLFISQILEGDKLYDKTGYHSISDPYLLEVLYKHAWAPPQGALTIWKPGVWHFEGRGRATPDPKTGLFPLLDRHRCRNQRRLRFVVGTHRPTGLSLDSRAHLGLLSENGLTAAAYAEINKGTVVHRNTMRRRTTMWKKPRVLSEVELWKMRASAILVQELAVTGEDALQKALEKQVPNALKRRLYGIPQLPSTLPLAPADQQLLSIVFPTTVHCL